MSDTLYWIWGAGPKARPAVDELERVAGVPSGSMRKAWQAYRQGTLTSPPISDLAVDAVARLRERVRNAPTHSLFFGAPSLREMSGGLISRTRERNQRARQVVFEDHGFSGPNGEVMLFFGRDAVSLRTLPQHRRWFEQMKEALTPDAALYFVHCQACADGCRLLKEISRIVGVPVYGADIDQIVGNQALEGQGYRVEGNNVRKVKSFPRSVLYFD